MVKVAINGFGRIGRLAYRLLHDNPAFDVVAINDLSNPEELAYLLKYDTMQGNYKVDSITTKGNVLTVENDDITIYAERNPEDLPWGELEVDVVLECTGFFASYDASMAHIKAGAKKVIINSPAKGVKQVVFGVNHEDLTGEELIISGASCTTNCLAPIAKVLDDKFGILQAFVTTVHSITNDQAVLDRTHNKGFKSRRGRASSMNIIPTTTGAAKAVALVLPELEGRLDGIAMRVPTATGSVIDLTAQLDHDRIFANLGRCVTAEDINEAMKEAASDTLQYTEDPIVSSDIIGNTHGSVFDSLMTNVLKSPDGELVKVVAWYDNEMSYTAQLIRTAEYLVSLNK